MQFRVFRLQVENDDEVYLTPPNGVGKRLKLDMTPLRRQTIDVLANLLARGKLDRRDQLKVLGTHLFEGLFDPRAADALRDAFAEIERSEDVLRIVLSFEPEARELGEMPWEYLYLPDSDRGAGFFLAAMQKRLTLMREVPLVPALGGVSGSVEPPLKVLLVVSAPVRDVDGDLGSVRAQEVIDKIQELAASRPGALEIDMLDEPSKRALADRVESFEPHVIHFFGHGRYNRLERRGELALVQEYDPETAVWVDDQSFADCVKPPPKLIFLHACEGARSESYEGFRGVALQLVNSRVPAVIAMQFEIENKVATRFATTFYESLGQGKEIDEAVRDGRRELGLFADDTEESFAGRAFGSPVVYLQQGLGIAIARRPEPAPLPVRRDCPYQNCFGTLLPGSRFCPSCKREVGICPNCQAPEYPVAEGFCSICGYDASRPPATAPAASESAEDLVEVGQ